MAKRGGILKSIAASTKRKATNSARQAAYMAVWGEEPPKRKKRVKAY